MNTKERPKFIEKCMKEVYRIAVIFMGEPPKKITWQFISKAKISFIKNQLHLLIFIKNLYQ